MDENHDKKGLFNNPLGICTFDEMKFKAYFIDKPILSFEDIRDKVKDANLSEITGSRVHSWRILLGLITSENNPIEWINQIKSQRKRYYSISK